MVSFHDGVDNRLWGSCTKEQKMDADQLLKPKMRRGESTQTGVSNKMDNMVVEWQKRVAGKEACGVYDGDKDKEYLRQFYFEQL